MTTHPSPLRGDLRRNLGVLFHECWRDKDTNAVLFLPDEVIDRLIQVIEAEKKAAVEEALDLYIKETSFGTELPMFVNRREYVLDKLFPPPPKQTESTPPTNY